MTQHAHFTPADRPLADAYAAVLADPAAHPLLERLNADDTVTAEDRYELAALLAVTARLRGTDPLPPA